MIVAIAEKPSVAAEIAKVLGANKREDGYFEGNGYQVTWTFGHLCRLYNPHEYRADWKKWNFGQLPMIPKPFGIKVLEDEGVQKQFNIVKNLFDHADRIINCGDAGQEGEVIQRWVQQKANVKCPVDRLWISSLTKDAIEKGFKHLKPQSDYDNLYMAGLARAMSDWLLGMNATRFYTLHAHNNQVMSVGRVQTPTLALIVEKQKEIDAFKPEDFWTLSTIYRETQFTSAIRYDKKQAKELLDKCKQDEFTITNIKNQKSLEYAPKLFDLTSLQVHCNKKYNLTAEKTLQIAQSLYEKKLTTYPRVDTTYLTNDVFLTCPRIFESLRNYSKACALVAGKELKASKMYFDDKKVTDHHAIIPTGQYPTGLSGVESEVYNDICERLAAIFMDPCESSNTTVTGKAGDIEFKATGKQILNPGWTVIYKVETKDKLLPIFKKGESGKHEPKSNKHTTTPPTPYTEATLLRAMETAGKLVDDETLRETLKENGIGRPSTRAACIETLFKRNFLYRDKKNIYPTELGKQLIESIKYPLLKSAELTGRWEHKMNQISQGSYNMKDFVDEIKNMTYEVVGKPLKKV